jgi:hypothetical protein
MSDEVMRSAADKKRNEMMRFDCCGEELCSLTLGMEDTEHSSSEAAAVQFHRRVKKNVRSCEAITENKHSSRRG